MRTARIRLADGSARELRWAAAAHAADGAAESIAAAYPAATSEMWLPAVSGNVYGTLLNFHGALAALGDAVDSKPYLRPPQAPILYIKPINTLNAHRAPIVVPSGVAALEMGATLGVVIGRRATRVPAELAFDVIAGYTVVNDVSVPHTSVYRPAIRQKCRDGFCPVGPWVVSRDDVRDPDGLSIVVRINGVERQAANTADLVRPVAQLIAEVTAFMTLFAGDVLLIGVPENAPLAQPGDRVEIEIEQVGCLENHCVAATAPHAQTTQAAA